MPKPALLYASPFPPQKSGISEYSRVLVRGLSHLFDVTLLTDDYAISDPELVRSFPVEIYRNDRWSILDRYPRKVYNIGNNPWYHGYIYECCLRSPGVVILHDAVLYFLVAGVYRDRPDFLNRVYAMEGARGVFELREMMKLGEDLLRYAHPERLPLLDELLGSGNRFLVHSEYARRMVTRHARRAVPVEVWDHVDLRPEGVPASDRAAVLARAGLPADALVVASFGFIAATKLNHLVCEAVERVNQRGGRALHYLMVGEGDYADRYLGGFIHKTGFVSEAGFDEYVSCADLIVNLRYPSMGETSGALLRAMSLGKPCIVTDHAWFSELPDSAVIKTGIPGTDDVVGQLTKALQLFVERRSAFEQMGAVAAEYVHSRCAPHVLAERLRQYLG